MCKTSHVYEDLIETFEREDDADFLTAVCVAKRHGSTPVTARFSVMDAKRAGLFTKAGPWQTYPRRMLQMRARSFALRDAFPDVLKGLISVEEALDLPAPSDRLPPVRTTIDAAPEAPLPTPTLSPPDHTPTETPVTPPAAETPPDRPADATRDAVYRLQTKQGVTTFRTGEEWLACWAKIVRGCKAANALDKLQTARETNAVHIAAIAAFDPAPVATLNAELARALAPPPAAACRLMTSRPRQPRRTRTPPVALSGVATLDEAAALLADLEGRAALRDIRSTAEYNQRLSRPPAPYLAQPFHRPGPMPNIPPSLGIFWAVTGPDGRTRLLTYVCALADAEPYGDCITSPAAHFQTWEGWRRGLPEPPLALLAPIIARNEYELWPRGRIVYELTPDRFVIYADRQLLTRAWLAQIKAHFHLPPERTIARSDLHYSRTRAIGPP